MAWKSWLTLLLLFVVVAGCGKKNLPEPERVDQRFSWRNVSATMTLDGCLSFSGAVAGAAGNVANIRLELEPATESCVGCPFDPREAFDITPADAWENPAGSSFRFAYCPQNKAEAYRWRISGSNIVRGLPLAQTPVRGVGANMEF